MPDDRRFMPKKVRRPRGELSQAALQISTLGMQVAGSYRREKETVGDLDILIPPNQSIAEASSLMRTLFAYEEIRGGEMKSEGIASLYDKPLLLNLWWIPNLESWGAMLLFATGPLDLNIMMRSKAKSQNKTLSQYGLFDLAGNQLDNGQDEADIFTLIGLVPLTPVERETWRDYLLRKPTENVEVRVPSSDGTSFYTVTLKDGKGWDCDCKGFAYRSHCRHLEEAERLHKG